MKGHYIYEVKKEIKQQANKEKELKELKIQEGGKLLILPSLQMY